MTLRLTLTNRHGLAHGELGHERLGPDAQLSVAASSSVSRPGGTACYIDRTISGTVTT